MKPRYKKKRCKKKKPSEKRKPPAITEEVLQEAATRYLSRYVPSVEQFRRVLVRKVEKTIRERGEGDKEEALAMVEKEIQRRISGGYLQDQRFAELWTEYLCERGKSLQQIRSTLYQKGIPGHMINKAIDSLERERDVVCFFAAVTYARKRRFGPFRENLEQRKARRQKDMASMLRSGHRYDVVREIFDCKDLDELDLLIQERE